MILNIVSFCQGQYSHTTHVENCIMQHPIFFPSHHSDMRPLHDNYVASTKHLQKSPYVKMIKVPGLLFVGGMEHHDEALFLVFHKDQALAFCVQSESTISHNVLACAYVWRIAYARSFRCFSINSAGSLLCFSVAPVKSFSTSNYSATKFSWS